MSTWEERMAERHRRPQAELPPWQDPPEPSECTLCYEWRRYPSGQEHFGFAWWRICPAGCTCGHHAEEVWIAATSRP